MIYYDYYADVSEAAIAALLAEAELGRLVTINAAGHPDLGLYPFVFHNDTVDIHLNRKDSQFADLCARPRVLFEVDDVLGVIPSYWVDPDSAVMATAYHRTLLFECEAQVLDDVRSLADQQMTMLARYQPEGGFKPVDANDPIYTGALHAIAAISLRVVARRVKFKLAQNRSVAARRQIIGKLRARGRHNDERAALAIESTLQTE